MQNPLLVAACLCLGACTGAIPWSGHADTCGEYPPGGGPAVIVTKDQQVCDVVRLRVGREIELNEMLTRGQIDTLLEKSGEWERRTTLDGLVDAVRKDAGDGVAAELRRAVNSVLAHSTLPMRADCPDVQKCIVLGAVKGLRFALAYAQPFDPPPPSPEGAGAK